MSNKTFTLSDTLYRYLLENSVREPEILRNLREETAADPMARMQIGPEQGQFMQLLVRMTGARRCLEPIAWQRRRRRPASVHARARFD